MRFLLHAKKFKAQKSNALANRSATAVGASSSSVDEDQASAASTKPDKYRAWGQQCSPQCGCTIRLESTIDDGNHIQSASYVARTVVTKNTANGGLEPQYTQTSRARRPLLKDCECSTLHHLANQVVNFLPGQSLDTIRNQVTFDTHRSSLAFQHAVLREHQLPTTNSHCFDLIEESLVSMVAGHMPSRRREPKTFVQLLQQSYNAKHLEQDDDLDDELERELRMFERQDTADRRRLQRYGVDRNMSLGITSSAWQFLNLETKDSTAAAHREDATESRDNVGSILDLIDNGEEEAENSSAASNPASLLTWETWVDELYRQHDQGQQSA